MNILEIIDDLMDRGYSEEEAYLFADDMFGYYGEDQEEE